jgi:transposase-like protein
MTLTYFEIYQMKGERFILRQRLVAYARSHGLKAAMRAFGCSRNTVRKWIRRVKAGEPSSLQEQSRRPHHCPHRTPRAEERRVVQLKHKTGFGAERLKEEFGLRCSVGAIKRITREYQLVRPRKRKHVTKKDLREVKKHWRLFQQISADSKYLNDIPQYWPQMTRLGLPRFQYTAREIVSGLTFTGYADELSKTYSCLLAERVSAHLAWHGVNLTTLEWQTDNGSEFLEHARNRGFPSLVKILGSGHHYIPVKAHTWQSDVETVHRLVEDEFFDRETFGSKDDFWKKLTLYWYYFNIARPNRHKERKTPFQIITEQNPAILKSIAAWQPLDLGRVLRLYSPTYLPPKGGHDLPVHPSSPGKRRCGVRQKWIAGLKRLWFS